MAHGAPDWTDQVQVVIVAAQPADETPIIELARLSTSVTSYGTVVTWTVDAGKVGVLGFIEFESDNYAKTMFKLTIGGTVYFTDMLIGASLSLEFPDLRLAALTEVLLEAKSTDTTSINVDGDIIAKEVG